MPYFKLSGSRANGSNNLADASAKAIFHERLYYQGLWPKGLPSFNFDSRPNYGRLDNKSETIIPRIEFLSNINSRLGIYCLNFVADAFKDFKAHFEQKMAEGKLKKDSVFENLIAFDGWTDPMQAHSNHVNSIFSGFKQYIKQSNKQIHDARQFTFLFLEFIQFYSGNIHFTLDSFIRSNLWNPAMSGLFISLSPRINHDSDAVKQKWINDKNFLYFARTARLFGFLVDKMAPWQLVFDVTSPETQARLEESNFFHFSLDRVFEMGFYNLWAGEMDSFVSNVWFMFNLYLERENAKMNVEIRTGKDAINFDSAFNNDLKISLRKTCTKKISKEEFVNLFSKRDILLLLFSIRLRELRKDLRKSIMEREIDLALTFDSVHDGVRRLFEVANKI